MIIDGRRITPQAGASALETALDVGSATPTLCHHPSLLLCRRDPAGG
jgi:NADH dehydrogenase/NADH:ubiquinone oxidoreductase subunit G